MVLVQDVDVARLSTDRLRRDALRWNFVVLGEAATQPSDELRKRFPEVACRQPARLRNRIIHGYRRSISMSCTPRNVNNSPGSPLTSAVTTF